MSSVQNKKRGRKLLEWFYRYGKRYLSVVVICNSYTGKSTFTSSDFVLPPIVLPPMETLPTPQSQLSDIDFIPNVIFFTY